MIDVNKNNDHKISCFKPEKPCVDGLKMHEQQMAAFCDDEQDHNPFDITDSDVDNTNIEENAISEDEDGIGIEI